MNLFLSWSGQLSQQISTILYKFIPCMLQGVNIFMSDHDLESGSRWSIELAKELDESNFGIICLTHENMNNPWILFEAGALTKHIDGRVCCLLLDKLKPTDIVGPLAQFQNRLFNNKDFLSLMKDVNESSKNPIPINQLTMIFDQWWPNLDEEIRLAYESMPKRLKQKPQRNPNELLEEILRSIRNLERSVGDELDIKYKNQEVRLTNDELNQWMKLFDKASSRYVPASSSPRKVRAYQIAKLLKIENTDLVKLLGDNGFKIRNHMAPVTEEMLAFLTTTFNLDPAEFSQS